MTTGETTNLALRDRNHERTRELLIEAAVALIERRVEPTMRSVAAEAGVGERTIYRYFANREALTQACAARLAGRSSAPLCRDHTGLEDYAATLFGVFEDNAPLIEALLSVVDLTKTRSRNLEAMQALIDRGFPDAPVDERRKAAAALRTALSGSAWHYQRQSCGLPADQVLANAVWLIATIRSRLAGHTPTS
jgi:AcrR family transcriptional regulator